MGNSGARATGRAPARLGPNPFATTGKKKGVSPAINVTPLVDVVLVLLIIFMVVMPSMQDFKTITMVDVEHGGETKDDDGSEPLAVTLVVDPHGREVYSLMKDDLPRDQVIELVGAAVRADPKQRVLLRIDAKVRYKLVRALVKDLRDAGVGSVSLAVGGKSEEWSAGGSADPAAGAGPADEPASPNKEH